MDSNVQIVLIVVIGIVVIVFLLKDRLTAFRLGGSMVTKEGEVKLEAAQPGTQNSGTAPQKYNVDVSRNKTVGNGEISVSRPDVRVDDNASIGRSRIQVKDSSQKAHK